MTWGVQHSRLEAGVGIEPAYTDLQSADTSYAINLLAIILCGGAEICHTFEANISDRGIKTKRPRGRLKAFSGPPEKILNGPSRWSEGRQPLARIVPPLYLERNQRSASALGEMPSQGFVPPLPRAPTRTTSARDRGEWMTTPPYCFPYPAPKCVRSPVTRKSHCALIAAARTG